MARARLNVSAVGGIQQYLHFLPAAFELGCRGKVSVTIFVLSPTERDALCDLAGKLGYAPPEIVVMTPMRVPLGPWIRGKAATLVWWSKRLRDADALLCAERTSSLLALLPGRCPTFIHIPHGFGDRAVGFERRIALFDHVLVAGPKDRERLLALNRVSAEKCHVIGSLKLTAIARMDPMRPKLFANDRPIILYNPHDNPAFSSANAAMERLIDLVVTDGRYNLIVAPHIKLAQRWGAERCARVMALQQPDRVIVDFGSPCLIDMTYTLAADCYVSDVSSQVYEFLVRPRPCVFIDAHDAKWIDNPDYAMWSLGPVVKPEADLISAIDQAFADQERYADVQSARVAQTIGDNPFAQTREPVRPDDIDRAAALLERLIVPDNA
jgi:hypothetical protein